MPHHDLTNQLCSRDVTRPQGDQSRPVRLENERLAGNTTALARPIEDRSTLRDVAPSPTDPAGDSSERQAAMRDQGLFFCTHFDNGPHEDRSACRGMNHQVQSKADRKGEGYFSLGGSPEGNPVCHRNRS